MNDVVKNESPSGLSIAALITGIFWLGIVPIILGAIDLSKIKKGEASEKGKGFDIAGIVLGAIAILFWLIFTIVWVVILSSTLWS
jgi:hypothetical protein